MPNALAAQGEEDREPAGWQWKDTDTFCGVSGLASGFGDAKTSTWRWDCGATLSSPGGRPEGARDLESSIKRHARVWQSNHPMKLAVAFGARSLSPLRSVTQR